MLQVVLDVPILSKKDKHGCKAKITDEELEARMLEWERQVTDYEICNWRLKSRCSEDGSLEQECPRHHTTASHAEYEH